MANLCPIDGTKIGLLGGWTVKDGEICNKCGTKVGFVKGDAQSDAAAHSYRIDEIRQLMANNETFNPNHAKESLNTDRQKSESGVDVNPIDAEYAQKYFERLGLDNLEPATKEAAIQTMGRMSSYGLARILGTLNGVTQRYQVTMNQTQIDQNWILIKQQDETNKLLRSLVEKTK